MTKSRIAALAAGLFAASPLAAQTVTAEGAMARYRSVIKPTADLDCPRRSAPEEIVVCARRPDQPDPERLPLEVRLEPGERVRGDPLSSQQAMAGDTCLRLCASSVGVNLGMMTTAVRKIREALQGD